VPGSATRCRGRRLDEPGRCEVRTELGDFVHVGGEHPGDPLGALVGVEVQPGEEDLTGAVFTIHLPSRAA